MPLGLSPRVRGSHDGLWNRRGLFGSIPACAGKPRRPLEPERAVRVYPRVCGEAATRTERMSSRKGLSPRVRGSRYHLMIELPQHGSIPACAGKPHARDGTRHMRWVYPRVCGEAGVHSSTSNCSSGLSPRVRGSLRRRPDRRRYRGSIPACAGKPTQPSNQPCLPWVYPRVCGEARRRVLPSRPLAGLSPRVRGSRLQGNRDIR